MFYLREGDDEVKIIEVITDRYDDYNTPEEQYVLECECGAKRGCIDIHPREDTSWILCTECKKGADWEDIIKNTDEAVLKIPVRVSGGFRVTIYRYPDGRIENETFKP